MSNASFRIWVLFGGLSFGDIVWCAERGMTISDWQPFAIVSIALIGIAVIGYRQPDGLCLRLGTFAEWSLLWLTFSVAGALLTYLAATRGGPLYDAELSAADAALGFDWAGWSRFLAGYPWFKLVLLGTYKSLFAQALFTAFWFALHRADDRNAELLAAATAALLVTTAIFIVFPTFGPCAGLPACHDAYLEDLVALRRGTLPSLDIMVLKGVIAFPSFHAVMATLFVHAHRGQWTFVPVAVFNALMLVSLPSEGGHYIVDVAGGLAVGGITLLALHVVPTGRRVLAAAETG